MQNLYYEKAPEDKCLSAKIQGMFKPNWPTSVSDSGQCKYGQT